MLQALLTVMAVDTTSAAAMPGTVRQAAQAATTGSRDFDSLDIQMSPRATTYKHLLCLHYVV